MSSPAVYCHSRQVDSCFLTQGSNYSVAFNAAGMVQELKHYFPDGSLGVTQKFEYDAKGLINTIYLFDRDGEDGGFYEFEHDGRIISKLTLYGKNTQVVYMFEHENDGRHIVKTSFYREDILDNVSSSRFDGNVRHETVCDPEGKEYLHNVYEYYDLTNQLIAKFDNEEMHFSIEYNEKGLPSKSVDVMVDASNGLYWDEDATPGTVVEYEYEYDSHGNWTTRRQTISGRVVETVEREIEY